MKSKLIILLFLAFGCVTFFASCGDDGDGEGEEGNLTVTLSAIPGITVPIRDETPVTSEINTSQYTGTISWTPEDNPFEADTVYTANIVLTAKDGFTLTGVAKNFFTVAGAESVSNAVDSGIVTAVFPATSSQPVINVTFIGANQTGGVSGAADSTGLTLTFDVDPTALTADEITVTGATKGALSGTGTTRTLAISDITVGNGETVAVYIASPLGYSISGSPQTAVVYRAPYIGMAYQGGIIAYIFQDGDPGYVSGEIHGFIASIADLSSYIAWYNGSCTTTGATGTALGTGQTNTTTIVTSQGTGIYAANLCDDYSNADTGTGIYNDWYLPSIDELNKLYQNKTVIGGFNSSYYWSSSEVDSDHAWAQYFGIDAQGQPHKGGNYPVRVVRSF